MLAECNSLSVVCRYSLTVCSFPSNVASKKSIVFLILFSIVSNLFPSESLNDFQGLLHFKDPKCKLF